MSIQYRLLTALTDTLPFEDVPYYGPGLLFVTLFWKRLVRRGQTMLTFTS